MSGLKRCTRCGEPKPLTDYYAHPNTADRRAPHCKKCDNTRSRKATGSKINRQRARHRAIADLIQVHEDEFRALLSIRLSEAQEEAVALAADSKAREHYKDEPVRLKPGKRMAGEKAGDRIDVARCPHCIKHHDQGHVCKRCGLAPIAALRLPRDGEFDEVAVERAMSGDPVRVTPEERLEAIRRLANKGHSDAEIARRLHLTSQTVFRQRADSGIESRVTA